MMERFSPKKTKLFVGLVGPDTTNKSLRNFFEQFVDVHIAKVEISRRSGKKKGFAYVICNNLQKEDLKLPAVMILDGKSVLVSSYEDAITSAWHEVRSRCIRATVTGIPSHISEGEVVGLLERFGTVLLSNFAAGAAHDGASASRVLEVEMANTPTCLSFFERIWGRKLDASVNQEWEFWDLAQRCSQPNNGDNSNSSKLSHLCCIFGLQKQSTTAIDPISSPSLLHRKDKHSKYEFISISRNIETKPRNYRFNIVVPEGFPMRQAEVTQNKRTSPWGSVIFKEMRSLPSYYLASQNAHLLRWQQPSPWSPGSDRI